MAKQLNVRNDAAYEAAQRLSKRLKMSTTEVVRQALEHYERHTYRPPTWDDLTDEQRAWIQGVRSITAKIREEIGPDASSDHDWLYDENGLPK